MIPVLTPLTCGCKPVTRGYPFSISISYLLQILSTDTYGYRFFLTSLDCSNFECRNVFRKQINSKIWFDKKILKQYCFGNEGNEYGLQKIYHYIQNKCNEKKLKKK